jgi:hypothetical protein
MAKYRVTANIGAHKLGDEVEADEAHPFVKSGFFVAVGGKQERPSEEPKVEEPKVEKSKDKRDRFKKEEPEQESEDPEEAVEAEAEEVFE